MLGPAAEAGSHHDTEILKVCNGLLLLVREVVEGRVARQITAAEAQGLQANQLRPLGGRIRQGAHDDYEQQRRNNEEHGDDAASLYFLWHGAPISEDVVR
jgi:hypothetical protein